MPLDSIRRRPPRGVARLAPALAWGLLACSHLPFGPGPGEDELAGDAQVYQRAQHARLAYLEREVTRLRADLHHAEESMVSIESGLRDVHTAADAVSALAEARIVVRRAAGAAPWRRETVSEAEAKLEEAERQLQAEHYGSAVFFASRAQRSAEQVVDEARAVQRSPGTRIVGVPRANLRAGPSTEDPVIEVLERGTPVFLERSDGAWRLVRTPAGPVGWLHASLLSERGAN